MYKMKTNHFSHKFEGISKAIEILYVCLKSKLFCTVICIIHKANGIYLVRLVNFTFQHFRALLLKRWSYFQGMMVLLI